MTPTVEMQTEQVKSPQTLAKEDFMLRPESIKKEFAVRALDVLVAKGISTPWIQRNAEAVVWSGVLLSQMIEIFRCKS